MAGILTGFRLRPPTDNAVLRQLVLGVRNFYEKARPETAYLHLDKEVYTAGETIWLRAYVADAGRHQLDTLSKVLHVELLSDRQQVVGRRQLELTGAWARATWCWPIPWRPAFTCCALTQVGYVIRSPAFFTRAAFRYGRPPHRMP